MYVGTARVVCILSSYSVGRILCVELASALQRSQNLLRWENIRVCKQEKQKVKQINVNRTNGHLIVASLVSISPPSPSPKTSVSIGNPRGSEGGNSTLVPVLVQTNQWP